MYLSNEKINSLSTSSLTTHLHYRVVPESSVCSLLSGFIQKTSPPADSASEEEVRCLDAEEDEAAAEDDDVDDEPGDGEVVVEAVLAQHQVRSVSAGEQGGQAESYSHDRLHQESQKDYHHLRLG